MNNILNKASEVGKMLRDSNELQRYKDAELKFLNDVNVQNEYNEYRKIYIEATNNNDDKLGEQVNTKYDELMKNPIVFEYLESKNDFEALVSNVNGLINHYVEIQPKKSTSCGGCGSNKSCCGK